MCECCVFNANPLHYYVLCVLHYVDRWCECGLFSIHTRLGQKGENRPSQQELDNNCKGDGSTTKIVDAGDDAKVTIS